LPPVERRAALDFTSALYLGFTHGSTALPPFDELTTGVPAALREPPEARALCHALAALVGLPRATLARSTLHAFLDLFSAFAPEPGLVLVDRASYPIARWGAERARLRGATLKLFPHHDAAALRALLRKAPRRARPWIVTDGFCTGCGRHPPLCEYLELARRAGGRLLVDDTQALGVLGAPSADRDAPYGLGGGGSLRAGGCTGAEVLLVASLAKGFGVPVALVAGGRGAIAQLEARSEMRVHASPPSRADLAATAHALAQNGAIGEQRRWRLSRLVHRLQRALVRHGLQPDRSAFPVQTVTVPGVAPLELQRRLRHARIAAVVRRSPCREVPELVCLVTARHAPSTDLRQWR
jgi:8-amino-7-oxononanoate synthase